MLSYPVWLQWYPAAVITKEGHTAFRNPSIQNISIWNHGTSIEKCNSLFPKNKNIVSHTMQHV
jgi:hypothetical protein